MAGSNGCSGIGLYSVMKDTDPNIILKQSFHNSWLVLERDFTTKERRGKVIAECATRRLAYVVACELKGVDSYEF